MRRIFIFFMSIFFRFVFWFRYSVEIKGLEKLNKHNLNKSGGVLFLPNHPAVFVDPTMITLTIFKKMEVRPMVIEYMYYLTGIQWLMKYMRALPVPNFESSTNSFKRKRGEKVIQTVIDGLKKGDNFLIYPGARLKHTAVEKIGGSSGVHRILQEAPNTNVVLVRIKGLWGSSFSRAYLGKVPPMFPTIFWGIKKVLKNLIFFTPRRKIIIEFEIAPKDLPLHATRLEFNRYLERYYNRPDGLSVQEGEFPGESLIQVSYSIWGKEVLTSFVPSENEEILGENDSNISDEVTNKVLGKLAELTELNKNQIKKELSLSQDLGLDSLDTSELAAFLQDQFDTGVIPVTELSTVEKVLAVASKKVKFAQKEESEEIRGMSKWDYKGERFKLQIAHGDTMPEVFLNNCARMGSKPACVDLRAGVLTYNRLKLSALLFAEYIKTLKGKYIGILLPAGSGTFITLFACQLAGKVPVMINWTVGTRHLEAVEELTKLETVLTSWAFLERLDQIDLNGIEDKLVMLETVKHELSIFSKIQAFYRSKLSTAKLLKIFEIDKLSTEEEAVVLFTSGTESQPKGVPLSHKNILENQRGGFDAVSLFSDDVLFAVLPPFHSFGLCLGTMGILSGLRTAYSPNPTDGEAIAKGFASWGVTIMSGAPTFIKSLLKASKKDELKTMRMCVVGAEASPPELVDLLEKIGKKSCLIEGYGITECSPIIAINRPGIPLKGVGLALGNVELLIIHPETKKLCGTAERGLILVRGPNVFSGYLNPGLTSPFIRIENKEWYNTGDLGFLDEKGFLTISGRLKRFIKIGAEMISLPAIEEALLHAALKHKWPLKEEGPTLAIVGKEILGEKPKITFFTTFDVITEEVNAILRESGFSNLVRVSQVIKVDEIPVMGTGKINYRFLEEKYLT
jgi:long-chain-fatty-acid--[acyl-carrier-protein] ligase